MIPPPRTAGATRLGVSEGPDLSPLTEPGSCRSSPSTRAPVNDKTSKRSLMQGRRPLLFIGVALLLAAAAFAVWENERGAGPMEITYTALLSALDEGRVIDVTVVDGASVEGRLGRARERKCLVGLPDPPARPGQ